MDRLPDDVGSALSPLSLVLWPRDKGYRTKCQRTRGSSKGEKRVLAEEIVITQEVAGFCRFLKGKGVLLFGLTDKPDESSIPRPELAQKGYLPLHRITMKVVGNPIF